MSSGELVECPACGGAGGGPFGRAGSAWDVETYECPRCEGTGRVALVPRAKTGLAKTNADQVARPAAPAALETAKRGPVKAPAASAESGKKAKRTSTSGKRS